MNAPKKRVARLMRDFIFDEEKHQFIVDGQQWPSITQILGDEGFIDTAWFTEYGRERGRLLHKIIHWHITDELDETSISPVLQGRFNAWLAFEKDSGFKSIETEKPRINDVYRFGGIPDHFCTIFGKKAIVDVKSGVSPAWVGLQLAAQEILIGGFHLRYSLQLKDNGKYSLKPYTDHQDQAVFLSALACWQWKQNNLKGRK